MLLSLPRKPATKGFLRHLTSRMNHAPTRRLSPLQAVLALKPAVFFLQSLEGSRHSINAIFLPEDPDPLLEEVQILPPPVRPSFPAHFHLHTGGGRSLDL